MWSESLCQRVAQRANYIRPYSAVSLPHRKSPFLKRGEIRKQAKTLGKKYDKALSAYKKKAGANK